MGAAPSAPTDEEYRAYTKALVQYLFADCKLTTLWKCNVLSARAFELAELGKHIVLIGEKHTDSGQHLLPKIFKHMCGESVAFDLFVEMAYENRYAVSHAEKLADTTNPKQRAGLSQQQIDAKNSNARLEFATLNQIRHQVRLKCENIRVHAVDIRGGAMAILHKAVEERAEQLHSLVGEQKATLKSYVRVLLNTQKALVNAACDLARKRVRKYLLNAGELHPAHAAISAYLEVMNSFGRNIRDNFTSLTTLAIFATDLYTIARMLLKADNNALLVFYGGDAHVRDLEFMLLTIRWSMDQRNTPPTQTPPEFWGPAFVQRYYNQLEEYLDVIHELVAEKLGYKTDLPRRGAPNGTPILGDTHDTYGFSVEEASFRAASTMLTGTARALLTSDDTFDGNYGNGGGASVDDPPDRKKGRK